MSIVKDLLEGGENVIRRLEAEESDTLEYKSAFTKDNKEFAKDVSAFANTEGGVIIYGIEEKNGRPAGFPLINISHDLLVAKENAIDTSILPPLHVKLKPIPFDGNSARGVLIIDIPLSLDRPHMVTLRGDNRYYHRCGRRSVPMSESEVGMAYSVKRIAIKDVQETITDLITGINSTDEPSPFIYMVGSPVPPIGGVLPVFEAKLIKPLYDFIYEFASTTNGTPHIDFVEYGMPEFEYFRIYPDGYILFQWSSWRRDLKERVIPFNLFWDRIPKFIKHFLSTYNYLGKSRLNVYFRIGTANCSGVYLDKGSFAYPATRFMRTLTRDLMIEKTGNLVTVEDDFDNFINSFLDPIRREF